MGSNDFEKYRLTVLWWVWTKSVPSLCPMPKYLVLPKFTQGTFSSQICLYQPCYISTWFKCRYLVYTALIKGGDYCCHGYKFHFCKKNQVSPTPKSVILEIIGRQLCGPARWQIHQSYIFAIFDIMAFKKYHIHCLKALCFMLYITT